MNRLLLIAFFILGVCKESIAQELNCVAEIIPSPSLTIGPTEKDIFTEMSQSIQEFMNNTRWTTDIFEIEERINCNILITITEIPSTSTYSGKIQVQSSRPVFNSSYNTTLLNHVDNDFTVNYLRGTPILPLSNFQYRDNLSAILSFYAYMILGYDYDSFELEGGGQFFKNAQQIANNAKNSGDEGWSARSGKKNNRYYMVDNVLQSVFQPLRKTYYEYHRQGFDIMYRDLKGGRAAVLNSLKALNNIHNARPASMNVQMFLTAKSDEIINLFSEAEMQEKNQVVNILKRVDPSNSSKYQKILN